MKASLISDYYHIWTYNPFWLNEGHTVFLERKIMARLKGDPEAAGGGPRGQIYSDFLTTEGLTSLHESVNGFIESGDLNYTRLSPSLPEQDPDEAFSKVPYEKGFALLLHLERHMGGPVVFEPYLLAYVTTFMRRSISSNDFKAFFIDYFTNLKGVKGMEEKLEALDWDHFLYHEGPLCDWIPVRDMVLDTSLATNCLNLAQAWIDQDQDLITAIDTSRWSCKEWEVMLDRLIEAGLPLAPLHDLVQKYDLYSSGNSEIRFRYQKLALRAGALAGDRCTLEAVKFVKEQGRMKCVRPLEKEMFKNPSTKELAVETFEANCTMYHSIAAKMIRADLARG